MGVNVGYPSRPPNSERYRLLPLAKLTEHIYYYKHMAHRSPYHQGQNQIATEATRCLMPENQKRLPAPSSPSATRTPNPTRTLHPPPTVRHNGPKWPTMAGKSNFPNPTPTLLPSPTVRYNGPKWPTMAGKSNFPNPTPTLLPPPTVRHNGPKWPTMVGKSTAFARSHTTLPASRPRPQCPCASPSSPMQPWRAPIPPFVCGPPVTCSPGVKFVEADNLRERLKSVEDAFHSAKTASPLG